MPLLLLPRKPVDTTSCAAKAQRGGRFSAAISTACTRNRITSTRMFPSIRGEKKIRDQRDNRELPEEWSKGGNGRNRQVMQGSRRRKKGAQQTRSSDACCASSRPRYSPAHACMQAPVPSSREHSGGAHGCDDAFPPTGDRREGAEAARLRDMRARSVARVRGLPHCAAVQGLPTVQVA